MVPWLRTMMDSSLIAGTYAPPAVHEPMTTAICGMAAADMLAWLKKMRPKCSGVGKHFVLAGQVRAARIHEVDAGQPVFFGDALRAQVLLDG